MPSSNNNNEDFEVSPVKIALWVVTGIIIFAGILLALSSFYTIGSGEEGVLLTFGSASNQAQEPGLHFKVPIVQQVVRYNMRTLKYGADATSGSLEAAASSDLQIVKATLAVNYHLSPGTAPKVYTQVGPAYESVLIQPLVHEAMKATTARYTAAELINKREQVSNDMTLLIREKLLQYNINVDQVSITQFDFSDQFNSAIEAKVTAEQQKEKAANDLERIKIEAQQVAAQGQGEADASLAKAKAQAESIRLVQAELEKGPQYVELQKALKWDGKYPTFYMTSSGGSSVPLLMNLPSSAVTGASN